MVKRKLDECVQQKLDSDRLLQFAVFHYGDKVQLQYNCQKQVLYFPDNESQTKYDCFLSVDTFSFHTKGHATADLAREQSATLALKFLKGYKSNAIDRKLMKQGEKLENVLQIVPEPIATNFCADVSAGKAVVPEVTSNQSSEVDSHLSSKINVIEGNVVDILQQIATESSKKVQFQVTEAGPGIKVVCKVGDASFQVFNQSRRTAKKLAATQALEHLRPDIQVKEPSTPDAAPSSGAADIGQVNNFCQKYPYAAEYSCSMAGTNFICNMKLISEESKKAVVDVSSQQYPTKKEAKKDACQKALKEMKQLRLL